jgi:Uma2 family endonuclease
MPPAAIRVSPEEYLERERQAEYKSEYRNGEIVAMAGASLVHARIISNLIIEIGSRLRGGPCGAFSTDLRLAVRAANLFTYPDVMVVCGEPQLADRHRDVVLNPIVLIEVLSKSTAKYDRGEKFAAYRTIFSLMEYLTVAQDEVYIQHWTRQAGEQWPMEEFRDPKALVTLRSIGVELRVSDVYEKVEFPAD